MATYWSKYHLLTPRNGRRKFRNPVHRPSWVLQWTSRTPSPSASIAHVHLGPEWSTVRWTRPWRPPTPLYPFHSSVWTVVWLRHVSSTKASNSSPPAAPSTSNRTSPDTRPTTPAIGGRS